MKGDYSQLGLMPGYCSEQIDMPSACLCGGKSSPAAGTTFAGKRNPFRTGLLSAQFLRDLAEIMVLIDFKGGQSTNLLEVSS
jgi:hypothetical protein